MTTEEKRVISLPSEQASYIDSQIARGTYQSASEVVIAALHALQERDADIEDWLRDQVVPVYDAMKADPSRAIPAEQVLENLRAHHTEWAKSSGGG